MKTIIYLSLCLAASCAFSQVEDREFTSKTLELRFETSEDASKWSVHGLDFTEWLKAISKPNWLELHTSQTDEFYFAIYRSGDYLIFCENDRKEAYCEASTSIRATDDKIAYSVWEKPSMWTTLKYNVEYPTGGYSGQSVFTTWKVVDGFSGVIILEYKVKNEGEKYREVLNQQVEWNKKQNKAVVDNRLPATSQNDYRDYNLQPRCDVALPVAGATPRRSPAVRETVIPRGFR